MEQPGEPHPDGGSDRGPISGRGVLAMLVLALVVLFLGLFTISWLLFMPG